MPDRAVDRNHSAVMAPPSTLLIPARTAVRTFSPFELFFMARSPEQLACHADRRTRSRYPCRCERDRHTVPTQRGCAQEPESTPASRGVPYAGTGLPESGPASTMG